MKKDYLTSLQLVMVAEVFTALRNHESWGLFIFMDIEKIKQHYQIIAELERDYGDAYYYLLGKCVMQGMDIETAIYFVGINLKKKTNEKIFHFAR